MKPAPSSSSAVTLPSTAIEPLSGCESPVARLRMVLLPAPFGPIRPGSLRAPVQRDVFQRLKARPPRRAQHFQHPLAQQHLASVMNERLGDVVESQGGAHQMCS